MGPRVWVPALLVSFGLHALALVSLVRWAAAGPLSAQVAKVGGAAGLQAVIGFVLVWSLIMGIWSALVANVLSKTSNVWGGLKGLQLAGVLVGLTLALDLVSTPCFYACPPTSLIAPMLSYVAIYNNSMPPPEDGGTPAS